MERLPLIGERFPTLEVQTTRGPMKLPDDLKGQWFVLFSHPADFTPVCTTEFVAFQKRMEDFQALGVTLIGLSVDQIFSHIKWTEWMEKHLGVKITFPIIAATEALAARLGMVHPEKGSSTVRAVFVVDPQGVIRLILYYPQEIGRNIDEILRAIRALKTSDAHRVAIPANWPHNDLIADRVILPPPTDVETARKRKEEHECFDWWFCHQPLP